MLKDEWEDWYIVAACVFQCYILNCPPLLFVHQRTPSYWCSSMAGIKTSVVSVWACFSILGLLFHSFSWSFSILPEAALQNGKWLHQAESQHSQLGEALSVHVLQQLEHFSMFTYPEDSRYSHWITSQRLSAWPKIQEIKYCFRWV